MRTKRYIAVVGWVILTHPAVLRDVGLFPTLPGGAINAQVFATPLPPGPGTVALPLPGGPFAAPVLMPIGAPTAAPVAIYQYPAPAVATAPAPVRSPGRFYGEVDFLYGATQGAYLPPLVTAAPAGTAPATAGALYNPTTGVLFGGQREGTATRPGFRLNFGYFCSEDRDCGVDAGFFFLGDSTEKFAGLTAPGSIILARPAVNGVTGANIGFPFGTTGPAGVAASFGTSVIGADVNYRKGIGCDGKFDVIAGFRYLHLGDAVDVFTSQGTAGPPPATLAATTDSFRTRNNFYGPQVGVASRCPLGGGFALDTLVKLAMGVTVADANLTGTTATPGGFGPPAVGGLLVGPTNAGAYSNSAFAVVPEVGVKLAYEWACGVRATFGYTFLYWSQVQRAPDQIDLTQFSAGRPAFPNRFDDVWVQGWSLGLGWKY